MRQYVFFLISGFFLWTCNSQHEAPNIFSLKDLPVPKLLGERILSTEAPEFAPSISIDGNEIYFNRTNSDQNEVFVSLTKSGDMFFAIFKDAENSAWIYESKWKNGVYQTPIPVPLPVGPTSRITNPAISPDGSYLIFSSPSLAGHGNTDLHIAYVDPHGHWLVALNLGEKINSPYADFAPHISPDGKRLFFTSERPGVVALDSASGRPPGDLYEVILPFR